MTTMVHVRIDETIKKEASDTLATMGLSVSDAVRVFLTRIASEKQIPFAIKAPNKLTKQAFDEAEEIIRSKNLRFKTGMDLTDELEKNVSK